MSESKHCILCHDTVWFGAYGTSKQFTMFKQNPDYETETPICTQCKNKLNGLSVQHTEDCIEKNAKFEHDTPGDCFCNEL
jgi:hypothetical protein